MDHFLCATTAQRWWKGNIQTVCDERNNRDSMQLYHKYYKDSDRRAHSPRKKTKLKQKKNTKSLIDDHYKSSLNGLLWNNWRRCTSLDDVFMNFNSDWIVDQYKTKLKQKATSGVTHLHKYNLFVSLAVLFSSSQIWGFNHCGDLIFWSFHYFCFKKRLIFCSYGTLSTALIN